MPLEDAYSKSEDGYTYPNRLGSTVWASLKVLVVISLQFRQHGIPLAVNSAGRLSLSPLPPPSFLPIPCDGKN